MNRRSLPIAGILLALAAFTASQAWSQEKKIDLEVVKYKGLAEEVLKHRGKVVVVEFWGTY